MNDVPIVLFGAFDRHNLGDFLLGHAAALRVGEQPRLFAGLRSMDLRAWGGFKVEAIGPLMAGWPRRFGITPPTVVHVGGEILDTDAWEASVMLLEPRLANAVVARLDKNSSSRAAWAEEFLGTKRPAPYVLDRREMPAGAGVEFRAVGGVGLGRREAVFRRAVAAALSTAERVTARDRRTQAALAALGVAADLEPDPATILGLWLAGQIGALSMGEGGYIAVQFSADFGDDAMLAALAQKLDACAIPMALFRAGTAPWHDDLAVYERLARRLRSPVRILVSPHIRDICALIAGAGHCLASSLHALIVAGLSGMPATGLERRAGAGAKLRAYAEIWGGFEVEAPGSPDASC